eukprot:CAMPEP_0118990678 /NCGR_PEP_ID=MMETSP1173-20130426/50367_1 /TAXON_ID=1034831 /ORGANISM="Rhizochromulina marina cf, Strain CCMP1243" /LENGTH=145 /DNA_ID=CAMNT_0006941745 /DNA_START=126 /DNA_END=559 /DNA_ORIENTATION=-
MALHPLLLHRSDAADELLYQHRHLIYPSDPNQHGVFTKRFPRHLHLRNELENPKEGLFVFRPRQAEGAPEMKIDPSDSDSPCYGLVTPLAYAASLHFDGKARWGPARTEPSLAEEDRLELQLALESGTVATTLRALRERAAGDHA